MKKQLPLRSKQHNYALLSFLMGVAIGFTFFIWGVISDGGLFIYYGDFNAQQIPFYQLIHDSVLNGDTMWTNKTDLGANLIGSYSFYLISSPFFLITLLFPSEAVPYLMAPLLILKLGFASLTSYIYLKRYVSHKGYAVIGGMLYAFSGFSLYNIFFNHFHEAIIIFPILLFSIDEYMYNKKRGIVTLSVFASCTINYYFFVGMVMFVIMYWVIRICTKSYPKILFRELCLLAFEVVIGFLMSFFILLPSVMAVSQNYRLSEWPDGWNAVLYDANQRYVHIIESFFFPPDIAARPNFTPDSNSNWASIAAWLPMVSMTGVIGLLQNKNKHWLKKLIPLLFVCALVPIFNAIFQGFNMNYYARWFYMPELIMVLATIEAMDNSETDWLKATRLTAGITVVVLCLVGLMPYTDYSENNEDGVVKIGLENYPERLWIYGAFSLVGLCCFVLIIKLFINDKKKFIKSTLVALTVVIFIYGNFIIYIGRLQTGYSGKFMKDYAINGKNSITLEDTGNVRSDFFSCIDNLGMYWQIPNIQAFHSIVPGSIMDFYPEFGVNRDVHSKPDTTRYGLRGLLSVKYLFDDPNDENDFYINNKYEMPGWEYYDSQNGTNIYINKYYIPMGFMYDDFISEDEFELIATENRDKAILKAMVLTQEQIKKYADITGYDADNLKNLNDMIKNQKNNGSANFTVYKGISSEFKYDEKDYFKDAVKRKKQSCSDFEYINNGFKATIKNDGEDNLLFFSVPYEDSWSATVNGKKCEIEKVNFGFMAVKVPGNKTSKIEFSYTTPGLKIGSTVTFSAVFVYIVYISLLFLKNKKIKIRGK